MSVYPNVLIISHNVIRSNTSNGKTIFSIFRNWPKGNLLQLYFSSEFPENLGDISYLRIRDLDVLSSFWNSPNRFGTVFETFVNSVSDNRRLRFNKPIIFNILRDFIWSFRKKNYTLYEIINQFGEKNRFKVYFDYKLKLKAYSKKRFDPFCRWDRINIPYKDGTCIETTIGQLNFFKWALENKVIDYIEDHYDIIEKDMNSRNSTSKRKENLTDNSKTRKKREELSISATKSIKKEDVEIVVKFH